MPDTPVIRDTVYFYKFNNYYNRIIKRYDTIAKYTANATLLGSQANCNFVHGDGVNSEFYWNKGVNDTDTPDYVVVDDYKGNISRWFVTNSFKTRDRQDKLTLRRDLIADFYSDIVEYSPCLIRKGYVPQNNPLIFNDEGVQYNKVKTDEILIKDESNCSYIVGFISNKTDAQAEINGTIKELNYDYSYDSLNDFPLKNYVEGAGNTHSEVATTIYNNSPSTRIYYSLKFNGRSESGNSRQDMEIIWREIGIGKPSYYTPTYSSEQGGTYYESGSTNINVILNCETSISYQSSTLEFTYIHNHYVSTLYSKISGMSSQYAENIFDVEASTYNELTQFNNKKIKIGNVIYNVSLTRTNTRSSVAIYNQYNPTIRTAFENIINYINTNKPTQSEMSSGSYTMSYYNSANRYQPSDLKVMTELEDYYLVLTEASSNIKTSLDSPSNRTHLSSQPFDMFMLINESGISYKVGATSYTSNHEVNINMAQAICQVSGAGAYDVQIVPFNPMRATILADGSLNFYGYDVKEIKKADDTVIGHYVMCNSADLHFNLNKNELKFNPTNYKKDYNLKQYRLCSPNQETMFEFSPSMNGGINTWEISCNYRPYASYIKVQPTWNSLYGSPMYNGKTDFRGLVYNSALCVTQLSDAWANYVSNNKNFQQLFDNQINTLTKQNEIQLNAMEETLGLRSFTGMPIGSILRVIGGNKDIEMTRELNNIAISKMETDFKYQMDNVKSMPHTIKKLTNINEDTRIFPFIEIYSATPTEEQSFDFKMKYTGYTIMTTGKIIDYCEPNEETFVQADLIRLDLSRSEETADNHIASEIALELSKGIYITKEVE